MEVNHREELAEVKDKRLNLLGSQKFEARCEYFLWKLANDFTTCHRLQFMFHAHVMCAVESRLHLSMDPTNDTNSEEFLWHFPTAAHGVELFLGSLAGCSEKEKEKKDDRESFLCVHQTPKRNSRLKKYKIDRY